MLGHSVIHMHVWQNLYTNSQHSLLPTVKQNFALNDGSHSCRDYQRAVELSGRCAERLGIGLVGFTGSWLLDTAIGLKPGAIVSASITLPCLTWAPSIRLSVLRRVHMLTIFRMLTMRMPCMQWLSFGDYAKAADKVKQAGIPLIIMVQSVEEAVKAAALGADAVVAQVSFLH